MSLRPVMQSRPSRSIAARRQRAWRCLRAAAATVGIIISMVLIVRFLMGRSKVPDTTPVLEVVCIETGWHGLRRIEGDWRLHPTTGRATFKLAAACPRCKAIYPFLDDRRYLADSAAALDRHADETLPVCPIDGSRCQPYWVVFAKEYHYD